MPEETVIYNTSPVVNERIILKPGVDYEVISEKQCAIGTYDFTVSGIKNYKNVASTNWSIVGELIIEEGSTQDYVIGSGVDLTFTTNFSEEQIEEVTVDGVKLVPPAFTIKTDDKGRAVIVISSSFLDTLDAGTHNIVFALVDGTTGSASINIADTPLPPTPPVPVEPEQNNVIVQTGDITAAIVICTVLMILLSAFFI